MEQSVPLIVLGVVIVVFSAVDHFADQRRTRQLLEENDRMWNDIINEHQQTIAEAFEQGKPCSFTIERH